jgi:hypothetical protein
MNIDDEVASYLRPGPFSVVIATCDDQQTPDAVRAWGPRLLDDRSTIEFFVGREAARKLLENLSMNRAIAMAVANMTTYQTVQLKGQCTEVGQPEPGDLEWILAHNEAFAAIVPLVGVAEAAARGLMVTDVIRLRFVPDSLFDQTPGPEAGIQR